MSTRTSETDRSRDQASSLIRILDAADATPGAAELRARSYALLTLPPGSRVVDVGCGAGRAVAELADRGADPAGVDLSEEMITVARRRHPDQEFHVGSAEVLPFGDGELAGYRADKVFHDLTAPERALAEAHRVLAPGGRIVLIGQDWDTIVIDSQHPELTRTIVQARADTIASPRAARRYRAGLLDAGFTDVAVEVHTATFTDTTMLPMLTGLADNARSTGAISPTQAEVWLADQVARGQTGRVFLAIPLFLAHAGKP
ncbi:methyltransferase domain-containing protein [Segeticoccus rhizosphaerae]|uniref:methyltransferase domain-containing protein n=1 Tax=Segeticoccus rhizosphaerae TaxID=1104777 RepID=UPI0010C0F9C6|nr:methyltransferase domain-containing protein [Ornithinicoccus soli]